MDNEDEKRKISFAPGCFDEFDGTQEELDELIAELTKVFTESTEEELMAMSRPLADVLDELSEDELRHIVNSVDDKNERKLH